ncbi:hypothetical protein LY78DRAFT_697611 [Colletotrichum sublineola]|uniref:Uncharacterized protein n=1 Tax=Colletotrichum sublineola TaxID=1173701 RepID=A0A066XJW7_COLSU|nr:hypothetical protein LY78DRAFT_697611 [Colletotrichum sublineola]KDN67969.1 hypothetical protein CSUB01_09872 [Colletotrichum sublineola]
MQFSTIIVALFAGIALATPVKELAPRQSQPAGISTECQLCRNECFFSPGSNDVFQGCLQQCNSGLGCNLTQ